VSQPYVERHELEFQPRWHQGILIESLINWGTVHAVCLLPYHAQRCRTEAWLCSWSDYRRDIDWWMDLLITYAHNSELTSNYSTTANLHNSQITTAPAKPFPAWCVFTSRSLETASNSGDSSASRAHLLSSQPPVHKSTLNWQPTVLVITSQYG
jgi:hypothetical protein